MSNKQILELYSATSALWGSETRILTLKVEIDYSLDSTSFQSCFTIANSKIQMYFISPLTHILTSEKHLMKQYPYYRQFILIL